MILDVNESLFANYGIDYIESLDSNITSLILPNWSCNDVNYTIFDISRFTLLESLEIGDDSFGSIETFLINDLPKLRSLKIGSYSFTKYRLMDWNNDVNKVIELAKNEFLDFGGGFELSNLKSLKSIKIGTSDTTSVNFLWSSFIIRGM